MGKDLWRNAKDQSVAKTAALELATEGVSSFPFVGDDRETEEIISENESEDSPVRKIAVWDVINQRTQEILKTFHFKERESAMQLQMSLEKRGIRCDLRMRKVPKSD